MPTATALQFDLTVNSQILAHVLRLLKEVVNKKVTIPILNNVLLRAEGDTLYLNATDLEISLSTSCPAIVNTPGTMTLPAAKLAAIVEQLPDCQVQLTFDGTQARLTAGKFTSRLQTLPPEDFPILPQPEGESFSIAGAVFRQLSRRTRYATKDDDPRYQLKGVLFKGTDTYFRMVATDGSRMAMSTSPRDGGLPISAMLSPTALKMLESLSGETDAVLHCTVQDNSLSFLVGPHLLSTRVIDGQFPNYTRVIPTGNTHIATINRPALMAALRRVSLTSDKKSTAVFAFEENTLTLTSTSAEIGDAKEELPIEYRGDPMRICLNWSFVQDFLEVSTSDIVTMALKDPLTQVLLKDGEEFIGVIMPYRE